MLGGVWEVGLLGPLLAIPRRDNLASLKLSESFVFVTVITCNGDAG